MQERILRLLKEENLTAGRLADILGVQPSSISHLVSGRNKPNFDFIANVLRRFPAIRPEWLVLGEGEMYRQAVVSDFSKAPDIGFSESIDARPEDAQRTIFEKESSLPKFFSAVADTNQALTNQSMEEKRENQTEIIERKLDKIVFFYSDRTFSVYMENQPE